MNDRKFNPYEIDIARALAQLGIDAEHRGDGWRFRCRTGLHEDHDPSCNIIDDPGGQRHGCWYCFSCSQGGTCIDLVRMVLGFADRRSAIGWLVEHALGEPVIASSVTLEVTGPSRVGMVMPAGVKIAPLTEWPTVAARFALERRLEPWQIDRWGIGYAVDGRLAGRIFIPVWGASGELLHYTARTFVGSPARYISAKRAEGFDEGAIFGEQCWPTNRDLVVVTEGALNALAVERATRLPFGSLFGSNVSLVHVMKLGTFRRVAVLTDPDLAGDRAAEKILQALVRHRDARRVELPRGVDPNDVERDPKYGPAELRRLILAPWS